MTDNVEMRAIHLSDGRHVAYLEHEGMHYLSFKNAEGKETSFKLSQEAFDALRYLMEHPVKLTPSKWAPFPWQEAP